MRAVSFFLGVGIALGAAGSDHVGKPLFFELDYSFLPKDATIGFQRCEVGGAYTLPHDSYCDLFYECNQGHLRLGQCQDGLAFDLYHGCRMHYMVDCTSRAKLQSPRGNEKCPRLYGVFRDPVGCAHFYKCANGTVFPDNCPVGQVFEDAIKGCRIASEREQQECWPSAVLPQLAITYYEPIPQSYQNNPYLHIVPSEQAGSGSAVAEFKCPEHDVYPYGEHSRHPYPGNCIQYLMCMRDKSIKVGSCERGTVYNPRSGLCDEPKNVPGCQPY